MDEVNGCPQAAAISSRRIRHQVTIKSDDGEQLSQQRRMPSSTASPASVVRSSASADDVDLQLVGEIIERASRDATTFPVVYQAYSDVLRD